MLNRGPIVVQKEGTARWLYEALRQLDLRSQQQTKSIVAVGRGESPDGSGNPLVDLTDYFFKPGIKGGQTAYFDKNPGGIGLMSSTSDATKGFIYFGSTVNNRISFDEAANRLGIGTDTPLTMEHIKTSIANSFLRPAADHGPSGDFSAVPSSPFYSCVDDSSASPSDTDYIRFKDAGLGSTLWSMDLLVNGFGGSNPVAGSTSIIFTVRARASSSSQDFGINVYFGNQIKNFFSDTVNGAHYAGHFYLSGKQSTASIPGVTFGSAGLDAGFNTYNYTLSATDLGNISYANYPWIVSLEGSGSLSGSNETVDISLIEVTLSTGASTYPLFRLDNGVVADTFDLSADGASSYDLTLTGGSPLYVGSGSGALSGIRILGTATTGRIEVGKNDQSLMTMILSGNRAIQGTQLTEDFLNVSLTGTITIAGGSPGAGKVLTAVDGTGLAQWSTPAASGTKFQHEWNANGPYIVDRAVDGAYVAPSAFTITSVRIWREVAGYSGATIVDLNKNGTTMYTTQANRPTLFSSQTSALATNPDITSVAAGDIITIDTDQIENGTPQNYTLIIEGS